MSLHIGGNNAWRDADDSEPFIFTLHVAKPDGGRCLGSSVCLHSRSDQMCNARGHVDQNCSCFGSNAEESARDDHRALDVDLESFPGSFEVFGGGRSSWR